MYPTCWYVSAPFFSPGARAGVFNVITHMNKTLFDVASPKHFHDTVRRLELIAEDIEQQESAFLTDNQRLDEKLRQIEK